MSEYASASRKSTTWTLKTLHQLTSFLSTHPVMTQDMMLRKSVTKCSDMQLFFISSDTDPASVKANTIKSSQGAKTCYHIHANWVRSMVMDFCSAYIPEEGPRHLQWGPWSPGEQEPWTLQGFRFYPSHSTLELIQRNIRHLWPGLFNDYELWLSADGKHVLWSAAPISKKAHREVFDQDQNYSRIDLSAEQLSELSALITQNSFNMDWMSSDAALLAALGAYRRLT